VRAQPSLHCVMPAPGSRLILSSHSISVKKGDRVAQLILEKITTPPVVEVEDLDDTSRGAGGFGSTGVAAK
jgi:dUTP pyrophosphatase